MSPAGGQQYNQKKPDPCFSRLSSFTVWRLGGKAISFFTCPFLIYNRILLGNGRGGAEWETFKYVQCFELQSKQPLAVRCFSRLPRDSRSNYPRRVVKDKAGLHIARIFDVTVSNTFRCGEPPQIQVSVALTLSLSACTTFTRTLAHCTKQSDAPIHGFQECPRALNQYSLKTSCKLNETYASSD